MDIIIGQEAICPDGLGRVLDVSDNGITVETYFHNRGCCWAPHAVELIDPRPAMLASSFNGVHEKELQPFRKFFEEWRSWWPNTSQPPGTIIAVASMTPGMRTTLSHKDFNRLLGET